MRFNLTEAQSAFREDRPHLAARGVHFMDGAVPLAYIAEEARYDYTIAMDAIPALVTDPNASVPAMLTTMIDPEVLEVLFAPNNASKIFDEVQRGSWLDETQMFPIVESTGEVSSYGDRSNNGRANANTNWPQRQSYLFQTIKEYGQRELERAGLARINWVSQVDMSAAKILAKAQNLIYFYGVDDLENYGILNDPGLTAALTPSTKAAGGTAWVNDSGVVIATANEIYADIQSVFIQLVSQTQGLVNRETPMTLALGPNREAALTATNSFNVNVSDLLKKNFPNLTVVSAVQYDELSSSNPQGYAAGNLMQLVAKEVEGQKTGFCGYNEKSRSFPIIKELSAFKQKQISGSWGAIIRQPANISSMVGI